ncbi:MAG: ATP-binding cassette domain-containing protein [Betaproteobacteria bacterium]|nr:ATP-binding cassette domain-containing protein [Betaproteobacteria bacterium]
MVLEVESLSVLFGRHEALRDVKIRVATGETVVILGANGAGKTTLLKSIGGLVRPLPQFKLRLDGKALQDEPAHALVEAGIALVPEGRGIFGELTVRENLDLGAFAKRARANEAQNRERVLGLFPRLAERLQQRVRTMSGGEQQMVAIGRALMSDPRVLLLDEPSLGLSPLLTKELFQALARIRSADIAVLLVEQNAIQGLGIADRGYVLATGRIVAEGPAAELRDDPAIARAYLGEVKSTAAARASSAKDGTFVSYAHADVMARARRVAHVLRERAEETSKLRRVPEHTIQDLWDADLWYLLKPRKFGGPELRPSMMYDVAHELGCGDGSAAWVFSIMSIHDLFMTYFPLQAQEEYWATPTLSASSFAPGGKGTPASGGFRLSGKWSFCSGIDNAKWVLLGAVVGMVSTNPPIPDIHFMLLPIADVQIIDDWHVIGLRGSGSKSVVVSDVFVPEHRMISLAEISNGTSPGSFIHPSPLYRVPVWAVFPFTISSSAAGIARGAFEVFVDEMKVRETAYDHAPMAKKPGVHMRLAEAGALIDASSLLYNRSLTETMARIYSGEPLSIEFRVRNRRDQGFSIQMARQAAERLFNAQGGKGLHDANPVQRAFRDLEAMQAHIVGGWDMPALNYGAVTLGGPPSDLFF